VRAIPPWGLVKSPHTHIPKNPEFPEFLEFGSRKQTTTCLADHPAQQPNEPRVLIFQFPALPAVGSVAPICFQLSGCSRLPSPRTRFWNTVLAHSASGRERGEGGSARVYRVGEIRDGGFGPERHRSSAPAISQYRTSLPHARQETGNHVRKQKKRRGRPDSEGKARHAQKAAHGRPNCGAKKNTRRQRAQAPAQKTIETASAYYARIVEGGPAARVVAPNFNERAQGRSGPSGKPRRVYSGSDFVWPLFKSSSFC